MGELDAILVQTLATTDATWLPCRKWQSPRPTNTYAARQAFAKSGIPWASDAATEAGRKEAQRNLEALAKRGDLVVTRPRRVKALAVKLSDPAELRTRRLVGLPGMYAGWLSAREILRLAGKAGWVPESALIGQCKAAEFGREAVVVEGMMLPALVRGFVESNSDIEGRVSYRLTPAGAAWLRGKPPADDDDAEPDRQAAAFYNERLQAALDRLGTAEPADPRELGFIPLPVSMERSL